MLQDSWLNQMTSSGNDYEIVILEFRSEDETQKALDILRQRKSVILQLARLKPEKAQRVVDWMAGGTYAINGQTLWLGEQTFLFVPPSVQLVSSLEKKTGISPYFSAQAVAQ